MTYGERIGREITRAAIAAQAMHDVQEAYVRAMIQLALVDFMQSLGGAFDAMKGP